MTHFRPHLLFTTLLLLVSSSPPDSLANNNVPPPNVLLIVSDDQGFADLSLNGHPTISTPNLDSLALSPSGAHFSQFTVAAPICSPSRSAMLTGRLPLRNGVYSDAPPPIDELLRVFYPSSKHCLNDTTLPALLKKNKDYTTAMVGKWHLGSNLAEDCLPGDGKQGFDFFFGLPYSHEEGYPGPSPESYTFPPVPLYVNDEIVEQPFVANDLSSRYTNITNFLLKSLASPVPVDLPPTVDKITGDKLSELNLASRSNDPWFIHMAFENPHVPLFISDDYLGNHSPSPRGLYGDAVSEMDSIIGEIISTLEKTNQLDNTLILFLSDNGAWVNPSNGLGDDGSVSPLDGGSNAPFQGGKGDTYEGGLRVPFIVKRPVAGDDEQTGTTTCAFEPIRVPVSALDILPTVLDYAGVELPKDEVHDGVSLRALLEGEVDSLEERCLFHWRERDLYAVRCGRLKAHFITRSGFDFKDLGTKHDPPLVFDIESDPAEKYPLAVGDQGLTQEELDDIIDAGKKHEAEMEEGKAKSLYLAQGLDIMPCCDRENTANNLDDIPKIWVHCTCDRQAA